MRLETLLFCGNPSRNWLPHLEFNEFLISFHNLGQIFRKLRSGAHKEFRVWTLYFVEQKFNNIPKLCYANCLHNAITYSTLLPRAFVNESTLSFIVQLSVRPPLLPFMVKHSKYNKSMIYMNMNAISCFFPFICKNNFVDAGSFIVLICSLPWQPL